MVADSGTPTRISQGGRKPAPKKSPAKAQKKLWVLKLVRIPFGFFEKEMLGYFRQFGNVLRIRVARNRSTGNHKGWAYVGFDDKSVAEIAAETMNGYLMFEQRLGCRLMKPSTIPKSMLKGPLLVHRPSHRGLAKKDAIARNKATGKNDAASKKRRANNMADALRKLRNMGVSYDFPLGPMRISPSVNKTIEDFDELFLPPLKPATPKSAKVAAPKAATPKVATPKAATPKVATPKPATPKAALPETPKTTKKVVIAEPTPKTPQLAKVKKAENTPKFSPKTRAAKAAAAGTPLVKSTLSKAIQKSVAASARPAPLEKKSLAGNKRGKKKSL